MNNLYFVMNMGCDATTYGLVWVSNEDFPKFKAFIENLNKNSHYGCMPTIAVIAADIDDFVEFEYNEDILWGEEGYVEDDDILHLDGKTYTFKSDVIRHKYYWNNDITVIGG